MRCSLAGFGRHRILADIVFWQASYSGGHRILSGIIFWEACCRQLTVVDGFLQRPVHIQVAATGLSLTGVLQQWR